MDDWQKLRGRDYNSESAFAAFQDLVSANSRLTKRQLGELESRFLREVIPLAGSVIRVRFRRMQTADRDDCCSELAIRLLPKVRRNKDSFLKAADENAFTKLMAVAIKNLILDHVKLTANKEREVPRELFYIRPQLSVPKEVELRLIMEELPLQITMFAVKRDRFGFGRDSILLTVKMMLSGKMVSEDMLRNWMGVQEPGRCIAFVTLMSRWFLYKYREKFAPVLDGELAERVFAVDQLCHVL